MVSSVASARTRLLAGSRGRLLNAALFLLIGIALVVLATRVVALGPAYFIQIVVYGLADGSIYALIALGYTMVYGIVELINFAHGDVFTLGGFLSLWLLPIFGVTEGGSITGAGLILPLLAILVISMVVCAIVNVTIERVAYRPLRHAPRLTPLITAVGMSFVLEGVMFLWRGPFNLHYPNVLPAAGIELGGANGPAIAFKDLAVIAIAIVLMVGLTLFVERTKLGKAMRATAQDRDAAQLMGIDINRTIAATFFIGALLAGAGGMIFGLYYNTITFDQGFTAGLVAFTAAVFGGIGNIQGAALGGLVIGIIQSFWDGYFDTAWTQVVIFAILVLVLVFRPTGLLGMRVPEK
ncbi:MAG: branched-chain amino acid transport system permease protein [Chloroflexota bacterium]|nr:branched-chain amino acid transport system permease protein [Chloroflexota bacterium]